MRLLRLCAVSMIAVAGPLAANAICVNDWSAISAHDSTQRFLGQAGEARLRVYLNEERHISVRGAMGPEVDVLYLKGARLLRGTGIPDMERFANDDANWLFMLFPAVEVDANLAWRAGPCGVEGVARINRSLGGEQRMFNARQVYELVHVQGAITADPRVRGQFFYELHYRTEPPLSNEQSLRSSGRISYVRPLSSLSGAQAIHGYRVFPSYQREYALPDGMTIEALRSAIATGVAPVR